MKELSGHIYLQRFQRQWTTYSFIVQLSIALAAGLISVALLSKFVSVSFWWIIPVTLCILIGSIIWTGILKTSQKDIARLLDSQFPAVEESAGLLTKPFGSLNRLEKLQIARIEQQLPGISASGLMARRLSFARNTLIVAIIITFGLAQLDSFSSNAISTRETENKAKQISPADKILPGIRSVSLEITPPSYTRQPARRQDQFSVVAEEGARLNWMIRSTQPVGNISLIFNDKERLPLRPDKQDKTVWTIGKTVKTSGFYQVDMDGKISDLYKLEIVKDQPAAIHILSPPQYSSIDFGEPQTTKVRLRIDDDYGITGAFISATISSGKGEGVKFKEQRLELGQTFSGAKHYTLNQTIDLKSLGMAPGDELYFYVQARDSRLQDSRSEIYIVTIQDTAQLMSMDGMLGGVNLVPEYFRSQRQIIIDTEKLIKGKTRLSTADFNSRSNEIATDQKLLRLRYGKFLGEEDDSAIGAHEEEGHDDEPGDFGNAEKLLDAVAHKHDQAEDATFFEPEQKAQLKATLGEMWKAELQLRLYKPVEALPFEYKALRLLKDLQQKSRAYVAKTSFKPPVIQADKRLSAELDKVIEPRTQRLAPDVNDPQNSLRVAPAILGRIKNGAKLSPSDMLTLNDAANILASRAAQQPGVYLNSLAILRSLIREGSLSGMNASRVNELESSLQRIIKQTYPTPQSESGGPASTLSSGYFNNLRRNR